MATTTTLTIRAGGMETDIPGSQLEGHEPCLFLTQDYVEGWHGTPQVKLDLTELAMGDGAAAPQDGAILYAARTCNAHVIATGRTRSDVLAQAQRVNRFAHRLCIVELADAEDDTMAIGCYVSAEWDSERHPTYMAGTLTIVCPDPRRYGAALKTAYMRPAAQATGGLLYSSSGELQLPLAFHGTTEAGSCTATLRNDGTSTAYPVFTTGGTLRGFSIRDTAGIGTLEYGDTAWPQAPITIDCLRRTATCNGVDVTWKLTRRAFPSVPPGGEITLVCDGDAGSDAYICASMRDTYI